MGVIQDEDRKAPRTRGFWLENLLFDFEQNQHLTALAIHAEAMGQGPEQAGGIESTLVDTHRRVHSWFFFSDHK